MVCAESVRADNAASSGCRVATIAFFDRSLNMYPIRTKRSRARQKGRASKESAEAIIPTSTGSYGERKGSIISVPIMMQPGWVISARAFFSEAAPRVSWSIRMRGVSGNVVRNSSSTLSIPTPSGVRFQPPQTLQNTSAFCETFPSAERKTRAPLFVASEST